MRCQVAADSSRVRAPQKILDLRAESENGAIKLSWGRPDTYAGGATMHNLQSFLVMRTQAHGTYQEIGRVEVTDNGRFRSRKRLPIVTRIRCLARVIVTRSFRSRAPDSRASRRTRSRWCVRFRHRRQIRRISSFRLRRRCHEVARLIRRHAPPREAFIRRVRLW